MAKRIGIIAAPAIVALALATGPASYAKNAALTDADYAFDHVSCTGADNEVRVIVTGIKDSAGLITADLFPNKEEGFLRKRGRLTQVQFAAKSPMTKFCVAAPESGLFAMSAYHDGNANGDFDKNTFGLPAEPWGLSNNPKVRFGPPPVTETLFEVNGNGAHVHIKLN
jgi:uncharacterized protein (DUF2141 family)